MVDQIIVTIIVAVIGAITGSVSLGRQFWKERARFDFDIKESEWYFCSLYPMRTNDYVIHIETILLNKGERTTSIHTTSIEFTYKDKSYKVECSEPLGIQLNGGDSKKYPLFFKINGNEIHLDSDISNVKITMHLTHKPRTKTINVISESKNNPES